MSDIDGQLTLTDYLKSQIKIKNVLKSITMSVVATVRLVTHRLQMYRKVWGRLKTLWILRLRSDEEWKKMYVLPVNIMKNAISPKEK